MYCIKCYIHIYMYIHTIHTYKRWLEMLTKSTPSPTDKARVTARCNKYFSGHLQIYKQAVTHLPLSGRASLLRRLTRKRKGGGIERKNNLINACQHRACAPTRYSPKHGTRFRIRYLTSLYTPVVAPL